MYTIFGIQIADLSYISLLSKNMVSVHQTITASVWIINLLRRKIYRFYKNIFEIINKIKYQPLIYRFEEEQYKNYMSGEIYQ
ncbi:hypothetical protein NIES4072_12810 [Nostoc commune NIES-4072]|uniref:Uncharacterized protein n=1 Tax=Nostoc commune NIES-4072 TaxID=2005467 RepID=A0A2R5FGB2_NOSCO|nr:hypothetical protein NIES4070_14010 [Nostoc commune HK-02]GBG17620.1 hypothetical protein NIES4072_12810 [Nostoc commune NIES-4072]